MVDTQYKLNDKLIGTINTLGEALKSHNRKNSPQIKDFLDTMLFSLTKIKNYLNKFPPK